MVVASASQVWLAGNTAQARFAGAQAFVFECTAEEGQLGLHHPGSRPNGTRRWAPHRGVFEGGWGVGRYWKHGAESRQAAGGLTHNVQEVISTTGPAPVARKPHYRYGVIHKFPKLTHIDGKEVTAEERERAGAFFSQASDSPYVQGPVGALPLNLLVGGAPPPQVCPIQ